MEIIAISNQKGGVGKTTSAINISTAMALKGYRTALIDIDSQGNATSGFGLDKNGFEKTMTNVFSGECEIKDILVSTEIEGLFVAPSNMNLISAENLLQNTSCTIPRETILSKELQKLENFFDYIFLDCPPSLGLLTLNALVASKYVLVTLQCEYYALEGIASLVETIEFVKNNINPELELIGILPTMYDGRTNLSRQVVEEARSCFKNKVFNTVIPRNIKISESPSFGKPIIIYDSSSAGSLAYLAVANELESSVKKSKQHKKNSESDSKNDLQLAI